MKLTHAILPLILLILMTVHPILKANVIEAEDAMPVPSIATSYIMLIVDAITIRSAPSLLLMFLALNLALQDYPEEDNMMTEYTKEDRYLRYRSLFSAEQCEAIIAKVKNDPNDSSIFNFVDLSGMNTWVKESMDKLSNSVTVPFGLLFVGYSMMWEYWTDYKTPKLYLNRTQNDNETETLLDMGIRFQRGAFFDMVIYGIYKINRICGKWSLKSAKDIIIDESGAGEEDDFLTNEYIVTYDELPAFQRCVIRATLEGLKKLTAKRRRNEHPM